MKWIIIIIALLLSWMEWYVIRKTRLNNYLPLFVVFLIGIPVGTLFGLHLIAYPILLMFLTLAICEVNDYFLRRNQKMSEVEKSRLKDL